jgi:hypothetical protein
VGEVVDADAVVGRAVDVDAPAQQVAEIIGVAVEQDRCLPADTVDLEPSGRLKISHRIRSPETPDFTVAGT